MRWVGCLPYTGDGRVIRREENLGDMQIDGRTILRKLFMKQEIRV
jgi:hypothetical protein